jgi:hypothetical protein
MVIDHELWDVRLRAVRCILRKLDCGIVSADGLSRRVDLLHRLSDWLRIASELASSTTRKNNNKSSSNSSSSLSSSNRRSPGVRNSSICQDSLVIEGIPCVIQLLLRLAEVCVFT